MDTLDPRENVEAQIAEIKARMPQTYKAILDKAQQVGKIAYKLVRRGLRGEANCFWAMENGFVKGTPFTQPDITADVSMHMVQFACEFVIIWSSEGGTDATL